VIDSLGYIRFGTLLSIFCLVASLVLFSEEVLQGGVGWFWVCTPVGILLGVRAIHHIVVVARDVTVTTEMANHVVDKAADTATSLDVCEEALGVAADVAEAVTDL
jgi:hypothetical protein